MFCQNCGNSIIPRSKFCSNCGIKIESESENKIDLSINSIKKGIDSVRNEISGSENITSFKEDIEKLFHKTINIIIAFLGYVGLIIILVQIFVFFKDDDLHIVEAYKHHLQREHYSLMGFLDNFFNFIPEILPTTILPIFLCFFMEEKKNGCLPLLLFLLL